MDQEPATVFMYNGRRFRRANLAESTQAPKLFLVDAMSLVFRAFFAPMQMSLVSPSGMPTKAVYIFLRTLRKLIKDHQPDHIAVAFDTAAPTFRDKVFEQYKANRPEFPEDLSVQLPYVKRFCEALRIPLVEKEGFEADDIIGTLAKEAKGKGFQVLIVSGDEDLFQLVGGGVYVLKPSRGPTAEETLCDAPKVKEILGVEPGQVVDWLALTGDPSDNIPGARPLPGKEPPIPEGGKKRSYIGPKGATELIQRFGSLEKVLENFEKVEKQSYREALCDYRAEALLSRDLATIRTNVPLDFTVDELEPSTPDLAQVTALCQELGFTKLLSEFLEQAPPVPQGEIAVEAAELGTPQALKRWLAALGPRQPLAVAMAVDGEEAYSGRLSGLGLADGKRLASVPLDEADVSADPALRDAAAPVLSDPSRPKAVHNSKLLRLLLGKAEIALAGVTDDTILYAALLEPLVTNHSLQDVAVRRLGRRMSNSLAEAAATTQELATLLAPEVDREGLKKLYDEIELPLSEVLAYVEAAGVLIDATILAKMSSEFEKELTTLTHEIYDLAGQSFDIDSPKQLGEILFGKLNLPGGKRLKKSGQYSTDATVLESLAERHELPRKVLEYRTRAKLKSTYVDALPRFINPATGRLHSSFNQAGARTGRLSSSNPNLQNIPVDDRFGLLIRSAFVAAPGHRLISADYSQIELRVLAHLSEDPLLIEAFTRDEDIHSRTAQEIFGVLPALQTREHRRMAKAINYGVIYGLSSFGLAGRTGTTKSEAQKYIDEYFRRYNRVNAYLERCLQEARETGRVRTLFGRMRPIPEINSRDVPARNRAEREAMNTPLQGTAADLLKLAMVKVHARLRREKLETRMILTVHDELVFEAPEREVDAAREIVKAEMEGACPMKVPLKVDIGVGQNWRDAK